MMKKVRQCGEAKDTARREWEEAEEFVADCSLLPSELKEEIRMYYADAFAALAAEYSRSREQLLVLGYDNYELEGGCAMSDKFGKGEDRPFKRVSCTGCVYHPQIGDPGSWGCHFMLDTGEKRGCPPTSCTRKVYMTPKRYRSGADA